MMGEGGGGLRVGREWDDEDDVAIEEAAELDVTGKSEGKGKEGIEMACVGSDEGRGDDEVVAGLLD